MAGARYPYAAQVLHYVHFDEITLITAPYEPPSTSGAR